MYTRPSFVAASRFWDHLTGGIQSDKQDIDNAIPFKNKESSLNVISSSSDEQQTVQTASKSLSLDHIKKKVIELLLKKGIPGLTICVTKQNKVVWHAAFGYCDVENQLLCEPDASMRIASISKSLFSATVVAPMIEGGKLDLKSSIYKYLKPDEFPKQKFNGKEYDITIEQLLSHTGGIKHYEEGSSEKTPLRPIGSKGSKKIYQCDDQYDKVNFYQRKTYRNVIDALEPFKDGPLVKKPGDYAYTSYGYTLLSAVVQKIYQYDEKTSEEQIEDYWMKTLAKDWKLRNTQLDRDEVIVPKRARYYLREAIHGELINAPYADLSVKWAGGGLLSTTSDLVKFGNALIDSYKERPGAKLKRETIDLLWRRVKESYGLGFFTSMDTSNNEKVAVYHGGGSLGASSFLLIYPENEIVVAILTNLGSVNLGPLAFSIANELSANP